MVMDMLICSSHMRCTCWIYRPASTRLLGSAMEMVVFPVTPRVNRNGGISTVDKYNTTKYNNTNIFLPEFSDGTPMPLNAFNKPVKHSNAFNPGCKCLRFLNFPKVLLPQMPYMPSLCPEE